MYHSAGSSWRGSLQCCQLGSQNHIPCDARWGLTCTTSALHEELRPGCSLLCGRPKTLPDKSPLKIWGDGRSARLTFNQYHSKCHDSRSTATIISDFVRLSPRFEMRRRTCTPLPSLADCTADELSSLSKYSLQVDFHTSTVPSGRDLGTVSNRHPKG